MYSHLLSVCGVHSCCVQTMDATSSVAANALGTAMEVQSKEIVGDLNKRLSKSTKRVDELKSKLKKQSRATVARGKACNHMMQEVMVKNVVQLLTVADMIRKAETKAECARWVSFLDRSETEAEIDCDRYTTLRHVGFDAGRRGEVDDVLESLEDDARHPKDYDEEDGVERPALCCFKAPRIEMRDDSCKLCFGRFQVIKNFRKMKDFYKCNVSERCYKVIKRDKNGRVKKVTRRFRMKGCKMSPREDLMGQAACDWHSQKPAHLQ